jgi:hypothetical protein
MFFLEKITYDHSNNVPYLNGAKFCFQPFLMLILFILFLLNNKTNPTNQKKLVKIKIIEEKINPHGIKVVRFLD